MASDPWIQRFDERADEDERYDRHLRLERAERMTEKASLEPWQARMDIDALQPDLAALPSLAYQGRIPAARPQVGPWRKLLRVLGWTGAIILAWVLAAAFAVTLIEVVAWFMDGP